MLLGSVIVAFAGSLWAGGASSYGSLVGARVVQGLGVAMFESIAFAIIGDLYFIHQRGTRMTLFILAQSGISYIPTVVVGKIAENLGWRWVFWILSIFVGLGCLWSIFFGWETAFNRESELSPEIGSQTVRTQTHLSIFIN